MDRCHEKRLSAWINQHAAISITKSDKPWRLERELVGQGPPLPLMAGPVVLNDDDHITDAPLLVWNDLPSLLTGDDEIIAMYSPERDADTWPVLALQAHPFDTALSIKPARDLYYFEQNKVVGVL